MNPPANWSLPSYLFIIYVEMIEYIGRYINHDIIINLLWKTGK